MHVERPGKEQRWTGRPHAGRRGAKRPVDLLVLAMRCITACPTPRCPTVHWDSKHSMFSGSLHTWLHTNCWALYRGLSCSRPQVTAPSPVPSRHQPRTDGTQGAVSGGLGEAAALRHKHWSSDGSATRAGHGCVHLPPTAASRQPFHPDPLLSRGQSSPGASHAESLWPQRRGLPGDLWWPDPPHRHHGPHRAGLATSAQAAVTVLGTCAST